MIDWSKLQLVQSTKNRSFEQLCFQIAKGLYGREARFIPVDDAGGGDGVEFYATFPDGAQWGWQAKFFFPDVRLTSSRKTQIKKSLQRACDVHPNLAKFFLCLPWDLTNNEREWFEKKLPRSRVTGRPTVPEGRDVELVFWGHEDLSGWLSEERFAGKRRCFFGELELSMQWFQDQFEKQSRGVRDKYERSLHTGTTAEEFVDALLGNEQFAEELARRLAVLQEDLVSYDDKVARLVKGEPHSIEWSHRHEPLIGAASELRTALVDLVERFSEVREHVERGDLDLAREGERGVSLPLVLERINAYRTLEDTIDTSVLPYSGPADQEEYQRREADRTLRAPASYAAEIYDGAYQMLFLLGYLQKPDLHVLGEAGGGKTHLACWTCDDRISNGLPAIFLPGKNFTGDGSLEGQLRDLLDVPPRYGWQEFVGALDAVAQAYRTRIPIVIDGLNEAVRNGGFSDVWERHLPGLVEEISKTPNVALITTSRSSYRKAIWPKEGMPENAAFADGFGWDEVEEAIDNYFAAYKIRADLTAAPLEQFEHPIYLRLFCEAKNPERREWVDVHVGEEALFEVFDQYLERCDAEVTHRMKLLPGARVVSPSLEKLASYLWQHRVRSVPLPDAVRLIDEGDPNQQLRRDSSRTYAMESEGLLVCRDWVDSGEEYFITYDLMAGYLTARHLLDEHEDLESFLISERASGLLYGDDPRERHPLHEDVRRALAALAPALAGRHLHEVTDNETAVEDSVRALFEIAPEHVGESSIRLVAERFGKKAHRRRLIELSSLTFARPEHPLNADFWHEKLKALPMPERDSEWSEHGRRNQGHVETLVRLLEDRCRDPAGPSAQVASRLRLLAKHAMWVLTSTVRSLRDKATRALYWYGRRFPDEFFALVEDAFEVDDPYVSERMLAACYGVAMACQHGFQDRDFAGDVLPVWATRLYAAMFAPDAPHATTHLLARNYARRTIEIAARHRSDVLTDEQLERTRPPYEEGGIRDWGDSEDKNEGEYRNGNHPFGFLDDDPMDRLGPGISKYKSDTPQYTKAKANLWWRIYDLGYSLERFGSVDSLLFNRSDSRGSKADGSWTDGYGRKYSWIATCELAGYRDDLGLLRSEWDSGYENWTYVDLDPSFPEELPEHRLVHGDLLGDRRTPLTEWIAHGPDLTFEELLELEQLLEGERGPWVLLYGHVSQHDTRNRRDMFCFLQGALVDAADVEEIEEVASRAERVDLSAMHVPDDHYTYAGEIPWCETYPPNEALSVNIVTGYETVTRTEIEAHYVRDGRRLSNKQVREALLEDRLAGEDDGIEIVDLCSMLDPPEEAVRKAGIRRMEERVERQIEVPEATTHDMTIPVRRYGWENYHSELNPSPGAHIPARQIADLLGLVGRPQTFDQYDPEGRLASASFEHGGRFSNRQHFTYLRKVLLDRYLEESGQRLVWVIYGERALYHGGLDGRELLDGGPPYVRYEKVRVYE